MESSADTKPAAIGKVSAAHSPKHFPALDGLRGVAILAVMLYHFTGNYRGSSHLLRVFGGVAEAGWMGVDLFFVLSGFLITGILYDTANAEKRIRNFYARRTLRIFPLFYGILFLLLLLTPVFHFQWQAGHALYFFYLANMTGLFAPGLPGPHPAINLGHLWSLAVEEQFYMLWPFVVWWVKDRRRLLGIATAALVLAPLLRLGLLRMHVDANLVGFLLITRADSLLIGGAVALLSRGPAARKLPAVPVFFVSLALLGVLIALNGPAEGLWMSSIGFSLVAICGACLVYMAQFRETLVSRLFDNSFLRFFGRYSYGLYVYHGLFFVFLRHKASWLQTHVHSSNVAQLLTFIFGFGISILLAVLSYHFFEEPVLRLKKRFS